MLGVPLMRGAALIGLFIFSRKNVERFTESQIELVRTFADQAVIAIENARLLSELRQSLEQQTATSEVLRVISSLARRIGTGIPGLLENAVRICGAKFGTLFYARAKVCALARLRCAAGLRRLLERKGAIALTRM